MSSTTELNPLKKLTPYHNKEISSTSQKLRWFPEDHLKLLTTENFNKDIIND